MEIANPIGGFFSTYVIDPITATFRVSRKLEDNKKELEMSRDNLVARRDGERGKLEEAKRLEGVEESPEAKLWFTQVDGAISDVNSLQNQYQQRCTRNCFCWSRYQLSNKAVKHKRIVDKLYEAEPKSGWTAVSSALQKGKKLDTVSIEGQPTTEKLRHEIIDAVLDDRYVVVGLHGMGGVGKTTLLRHAYEHYRQANGFESVIFVTVSGTPNFVEIRKQIAESLGLTNCRDDNVVKEFLCRQTRKYLLILDDMWEPVDLGEICIPTPTNENSCKILMASRSKSVVTKFVTRFAVIRSLQTILVRSLPPEEAWNLFVQKVGEEITSRSTIEPLARKVLKKCDGLPLAIIVIGGTMSTRETMGEWRDAVRELDQCASKFEDIKEEVFPKLMFSFKKLEPTEQSLFLYCCLFPEDASIKREELLYFAIGEGTLCDKMHRLAEMRNKVDVWVGKLLNSSMLEHGEYRGLVKMHDVMRQLGVWITSLEQNKDQHSTKFIAKASARITEAPHASEWAQATKISLKHNKIASLPQLPNQCPLLHTLLLDRTPIKDIPQVPLHFLEHMPALQILDLSYTMALKYLPPSISHLVNLRVLVLNECHDLQELPSEIGMLGQLVVLDLTSCRSLIKLPVEMSGLHNLRFLYMSGIWDLESIPHGVLSGLHKLEELEARQMKFDSYNLEELSRLTCLTYVAIFYIKDVRVSHWSKPLAESMIGLWLENCAFDPSVALPDLLEDISEDFSYFSSIYPEEKCNRQVTFISCEGLTRVPTRGAFKQLTVQECPDLKSLLFVEEVRGNAFESLYELRLLGLDQLETICSGIPQPEYGCFTNLEIIFINGCPTLKEIFTKGVTPLLKKLNTLCVYGCSQLVKLVSDDDLVDDSFPSLKMISVCELPELKAVCDRDLNWPSLHKAHVNNCPKLSSPNPFGARREDILLYDEWGPYVHEENNEEDEAEEEEEEDKDEEDEEEEEEED